MNVFYNVFLNPFKPGLRKQWKPGGLGELSTTPLEIMIICKKYAHILKTERDIEICKF